MTPRPRKAGDGPKRCALTGRLRYRTVYAAQAAAPGAQVTKCLECGQYHVTPSRRPPGRRF